MSNLVNSEYVKFKVNMIPPQIISYYKLKDLTHDGYIYAKINKTWYRLKQAGRIAYDDLVQHLKNKHLYKPRRPIDSSLIFSVMSLFHFWSTILG